MIYFKCMPSNNNVYIPLLNNSPFSANSIIGIVDQYVNPIQTLSVSILDIGNSCSVFGVPIVKVTIVSDLGKTFIKSWEQGPNGNGQPALKVYDDADQKYKEDIKDLTGRPKGFWTIGYGHLLLPGENFDKGITSLEAEQLFENDLKKKSLDIISHNVTAILNQQQFDALASYVFNTGSLKGTKLLTNINNNNFEAAVKEMDITTSGGKVMRGLVIRRQNEQDMWLKGIYENHK